MEAKPKVFRSLKDVQGAFAHEARWGQSAQAPDKPDDPKGPKAEPKEDTDKGRTETPDSPSPRDVPDGDVIEKTLPKKPLNNHQGDRS
jgi:hypothetical protein